MSDSITLGNGIDGESLRIKSASPATYFEAISVSIAVDTMEIAAHLFLPKSSDPLPIVVMVPGSLGISDNNVRAATSLVDAGIACCLIDPYTDSVVSSTIANQEQFSVAASVRDVLVVANELSGQENIDKVRIDAQGHSLGGKEVLLAACISSRR